MAAMTFFALLVVLLFSDGWFDSLIAPGWIPLPMLSNGHYLLRQRADCLKALRSRNALSKKN